MKENKRILIFLVLVVIILLVGGGIYFWQKSGGEPNWDNVDQVFDIDIPEDFDDSKIERLNEKIEQARDIYEKRNEDNWAWVTLGNMYEFAKDYDRAILAYQKSLEMSPYDIVSSLNLASIYEDQFSDFEQAIFYYNKAIDIHPQNSELYDRLAKLYYQKMKDYGRAERVYAAGLEQTAEDPGLLVDVIRFYERAEQKEPMVFYIKRLLELYPDNEIYQKEFGHLAED